MALDAANRAVKQNTDGNNVTALQAALITAQAAFDTAEGATREAEFYFESLRTQNEADANAR